MNRDLRKDINNGIFFSVVSMVILLAVIFMGAVIYKQPEILLIFVGFIFLFGVGVLIGRNKRNRRRK